MGSDQSSNREKAATARDVQKALDEQSRMYEQRIASIIQENRRQTATATVPQKQPVVTRYSAVVASPTPRPPPPLSGNSLERQRSPYSYTTNDLQSQISSAASTSNSLYPNLAFTASNQATSPASSSAYNPFANHNANPKEFVRVNSNMQRPQATHAPPQRYQPIPTAPPIETSTTNVRSRSRQRGGQDEDVKCKTCGNNYGEKIFQCNRGHSSCATCKTRQAPCGVCFLVITTTRNYNLEKHLSERKVACQNAPDGCRLYVKIAELETHAKECPFKVLECPSIGLCAWRGKLPQLLEHFKAMHPIHCQGDVDKEMFLSKITDDASINMHFIQIGTFNFLFHIKITQTGLYMAAQLIGTKHSAAKWNYEAHIYNKSQPRRKYKYVDLCSSSSESIADIFDGAQCALIPRNYAKTFICGGTLAYKFYIMKDETAKEIVTNKRWNGPRRYANKNNNNN